ncbi:MAG: D-amino acid dehydrogenase [Proteobacteria bacterium]|nr:D-amino acid dehydrogenase [Pseudomonadota bacterium]
MKVLVLGAGVIGVTTAYFLNRAGHEVTVVDAEDGPAQMTSFANGGHISGCNASAWGAPGVPLKMLKWIGRDDAPLLMHLRFDPQLVAWGLRFLRNCTKRRYLENTRHIQEIAGYSRKMHKEVRAATGVTFDHNADGILNLFRTDEDFAGARAKIPLWREVGLDPQVLDRDGLLAVEPALESARHLYRGGIFSAVDEAGDAYQFTTRLAEWCAANGIAFRYSTRIWALEHADGRIAGVGTDGGRLEAEAYVACLGAESPLLLRSLGLRLPIYPGKGYSVTVPVAGHNGAPRVSLTDESVKVVFARLGDRFRAAGTVELAGYDLSLNEKRAEATKAVMQGLFPDGGDYARASFWAGLRPMTPDGRPLIGRTRFENLFLNTGHGPLGWTFCCGSARLVADIVGGKAPALDPAPFALARFRGHRVRDARC